MYAATVVWYKFRRESGLGTAPIARRDVPTLSVVNIPTGVVTSSHRTPTPRFVCRSVRFSSWFNADDQSALSFENPSILVSLSLRGFVYRLLTRQSLVHCLCIDHYNTALIVSSSFRSLSLTRLRSFSLCCVVQMPKTRRPKVVTKPFPNLSSYYTPPVTDQEASNDRIVKVALSKQKSVQTATTNSPKPKQMSEPTDPDLLMAAASLNSFIQMTQSRSEQRATEIKNSTWCIEFLFD